MDNTGFVHGFLPVNFFVSLVNNNKIMVAVVGTFQNGYVKLDREYVSDAPVKVIVTFLEDIQTESETVLSLSDFSFAKSQENLDHIKTSFSDEIIEERREL